MCACSVSGSLIHAEEMGSVKPAQARFVAGYETLRLSGNEKIGLLGGSFLYDMNDWLALGGGSYGAMAGKRGGFITLGFAGEMHKRISEHFEVQAGMFVGAGGGGGGYKLQGGGLMLRGYLGGMFHTEALGAIGLGLSRVEFPDGAIHSTQPYLSYALPFQTLIPPGWIDLPTFEASPWLGVRTAEQEFSVVYRLYMIPAGVLANNGRLQHRSMGLAGVEWNRYLDDHVYLKLESEGAMQGKSNGYMQILLGAGYRQAITDSTWLKLSASLGPAGGGNVATGGGVLLDAQLLLQQRLSEHVFAQAGTGYVKATGGSFRAASVSVMLGYHFFNPDVHEDVVDSGDLADFEARHLRVRMVKQRYLKDAPNWRNHHANLNVDLLGYQLDYFPNDWFFLSGQGIGAYKGMGGGYMTGLVGGGVRLPVFRSPLFVEMDALVGAGGGGGLDMAGGLVWQADAALGWQISKRYSLQASYGLMQAPKGHFKARVISLSLGYYFSLPVL